ncbi:pathogenesis-related thaumatin-like protein 3.5 [Ipomoea triloba]|uniref:pathogenesis-related thaumatin-like protein 3.5 n=1 Tax=Ipomoea triloba TaxID=35885 RepID=UPI00125E5FB3|nr:pathogenesis-related thaumatin-like protein 3.5 [Ipomoea triloba]
MAFPMHLFLTLLCISSLIGVDAAIFTLKNRCNVTIWPGIQSGAGHPVLMKGGLVLEAGQSERIDAPAGWSGRIWPRSGCAFDKSTGRGSCGTGDCGGTLQCDGAGGAPPASLAEFTLDSPLDFYDVSLVDGFNVPVSIFPSGGSGDCSEVKCLRDLNRSCPQELQVRSTGGEVIACKSACNAFNKPEYCCTGEFGNPQTCQPTNYSRIFKNACPRAYSYPYDDATSTFTCTKADYLIAFC